MYNSIRFSLLFLMLLLSIGCQQKEEARRPLTQSKLSSINTSIERNIEVVKDEEGFFKNYIATDTSNTYTNSKNGFWYTYIARQLKDSIRPQTGDLVNYTYAVHSINDSLIYSNNEIGNLTYRIDKEDILPILRHSLKMMKANETIKVLSPSALAYGYVGDQKKIKKNQPLIFTITLLSIEYKTNY